VVDVDANDCRADVEIIEASESWINSETAISVHLSELYPILDQENDALNMDQVGEALDLYRFFYKNIWRPWDAETPVEDWPDKVLINRIQLAFDLVSKCGNWGAARQLETLASAAQHTMDELTDLEATAGELDEDELDEDLAARVSQLVLRKAEIKKKAELLENPDLREFFTCERQQERRNERKNGDPGIILVWKSGPVQDMVDIASRLQQDCSGSEELHVVPLIQHAADISVAKDRVVIASRGTHLLERLGDLSNGGSIEGSAAFSIDQLISTTEQQNSKRQPRSENATLICPDGVSNMFLEISGDFKMKNIVLDLPSSLKTGIVVSSGKLSLENVIIQGGKVGIAVLTGAEVELTNCAILNCNTAILQDSAATLHLGNTQILNCQTKIDKKTIAPGSIVQKDTGRRNTLFNISHQGSPLVRRLDFGGMRGRSSSTPKCQDSPDNEDGHGLMSGFANSSQESDINYSQ